MAVLCDFRGNRHHWSSLQACLVSLICSLYSSGFINRPTYMPKERFEQEKKGIAVRIQQLIAEGESITKMMEVVQRFDFYRRERREAT